MARYDGSKCRVRFLCLGNDILADDALGLDVAAELRKRAYQGVEIVESMESGLHLLDCLLDVDRVVVIDTIQEGSAPPGTIYQLREDDVRTTSEGSPHYVGLFDALRMGRRLGMPVADEVLIVAVEAADCTTLGGDMHPAVRSAIPDVVELALQLMA
jgi:hydrogenase maturation protease